MEFPIIRSNITTSNVGCKLASRRTRQIMKVWSTICKLKIRNPIGRHEKMNLIFNIITYTCTSKIAPKMEAQLVPCKRRSWNDTNSLIFKDTILKTYILLLYFQNIFDKTIFITTKTFMLISIFICYKNMIWVNFQESRRIWGRKEHLLHFLAY